MQIMHFRPINTIFDKFYIERSSISNWRSPMKFGYTSYAIYNEQPKKDVIIFVILGVVHSPTVAQIYG